MIPIELQYLFPKKYIKARADAKKAICKKGKPCKTTKGNYICIPKKAVCASDQKPGTPKPENKSNTPTQPKGLIAGLAIGALVGGAGIGGLTLLASSQRNRELDSGKKEFESAAKVVNEQAERKQQQSVEDIKLAAKVEVETAEAKVKESEAKKAAIQSDLDNLDAKHKTLESEHEAVKSKHDELSKESLSLAEKLAEKSALAEDQQKLIETQSKAIADKEVVLAKVTKSAESNQQALLKIDKEKKQLADQQKSSLGKIKELESESLNLKKSVSDVNSELGKAQESYKNLSQEHEKAKGENLELGVKLQNQKVYVDDLKRRGEEAAKEIEAKDREIEGHKQDVILAKELIVQKEQQAKTAETYKKSLETQKRNLTADKEKLQTESEKVKKALEKSRSETKSVTEQLNKSQEENAANKAEIDALRKSVDAVNSDREKVATDLGTKSANLDLIAKQLEDKSLELDAANQSLKKVQGQNKLYQKDMEKLVEKRVKERTNQIEQERKDRLAQLDVEHADKVAKSIQHIQIEHESKLITQTKKIREQAFKDTDPAPKPGEGADNLVLGAEDEIRIGATARRVGGDGKLSKWSKLGTREFPYDEGERLLMGRVPKMIEENFVPASVQSSKMLRDDLEAIHKIAPGATKAELESRMGKDLAYEVDRKAKTGTGISPYLLSSIDTESARRLALIEHAVKTHDQRESRLKEDLKDMKEAAVSGYAEIYSEMKVEMAKRGGYDSEIAHEFDRKSLEIARLMKKRAARLLTTEVQKTSTTKPQTTTRKASTSGSKTPGTIPSKSKSTQTQQPSNSIEVLKGFLSKQTPSGSSPSNPEGDSSRSVPTKIYQPGDQPSISESAKVEPPPKKTKRETKSKPRDITIRPPNELNTWG